MLCNRPLAQSQYLTLFPAAFPIKPFLRPRLIIQCRWHHGKRHSQWSRCGRHPNCFWYWLSAQANSSWPNRWSHARSPASWVCGLACRFITSFQTASRISALSIAIAKFWSASGKVDPDALIPKCDRLYLAKLKTPDMQGTEGDLLWKFTMNTLLFKNALN